MRSLKIIVEKHADGYVAYPLGVRRAVVGQGDACEAAPADVRSAIAFHVETFGPDALIGQSEAWKPAFDRADRRHSHSE